MVVVDLVAEEIVCRELGLAPAILRQWVELGLVEATRSGETLRFEIAQIRRIWSLKSLQEDLEVNLAGAGIILEMADEIRTLKAALSTATRRLSQVRRLEEYRVSVLEEQVGPLEWDVDLPPPGGP